MNRALDVAAAGVGLALTSPVLATAAIAIKLEDGGSVFYRQRRVGVDGGEFELLKLRTMEVGAETRGAGFGGSPSTKSASSPADAGSHHSWRTL